MKIDLGSLDLQPKQQLLEKKLEDVLGPVILGIGGSKGSAKSHGLRAVMLRRRLKYHNTTGMMFRRKMKQVRDSLLDGGFFKTWPKLREFWREKERSIVLPNNSRIYFGIAEHPDDINDFQGAEYMDVFIDEATRLTELELIKLNETRRWTGMTQIDGKGRFFHVPDRLCKTVYGMNPGGPGHAYIRRLMYLKEYHKTERASDYGFIPMFAWDNVEWARSALGRDRIDISDYYDKWTDKDRFKYFIECTQRGQELNALPQRLRTGWLLGQWNDFAGQFFEMDLSAIVKPCLPDREWHPRWLGIDWGFQHPCACYWNARVGKVVKVYREHVENLKSARSQAQAIVDRTPEDERKLIDRIYLSPDAFQKRDEKLSFAQLMGEVFKRYGMPYPTMADDDRKHGFQACYDLMDDGEMEIDPQCKQLIETIPMVCTEEDDPEEIQKFDGDDPVDAWRYGIKSRLSEGKMPINEQVDEQMKEFAKARGMKRVEQLDINTLASVRRRLTHQALTARRRFKVPFGKHGTIWHPQRHT